MKKTALLAALAISISSALFAQEDKSIALHLPTQKGSMLIGSNLLLAEYTRNSTHYSQYNSYDIGISPRVGYFIKDNLAVGLTLNAAVAGQTNYYYSLNGGLNVFGRYYFGKAADKNGVQNKLRFFVEAGAGYFRSFISERIPSMSGEDSTRETYHSSFLNFSVMPGVNYFLNKNTALELGLYYQRTKEIGEDRSILFRKTERLGLNVGMQYFFGKR